MAEPMVLDRHRRTLGKKMLDLLVTLDLYVSGACPHARLVADGGAPHPSTALAVERRGLIDVVVGADDVTYRLTEQGRAVVAAYEWGLRFLEFDDEWC